MKNCNAEGFIVITFDFFTDKYAGKPYCKAFWRICDYHARAISSPELNIRIQVLNLSEYDQIPRNSYRSKTLNHCNE